MFACVLMVEANEFRGNSGRAEIIGDSGLPLEILIQDRSLGCDY